MMNALKITVFIMLLAYVAYPVLSDCTSPPTCNAGDILDKIRCKCLPNVNCSDPYQDSGMCQFWPCNATTTPQCKYKCNCLSVTTLTNYCPPCFNGGTQNKDTCQCTCSTKYAGERCQYPVLPAQAADAPFCYNVDCFHASENDYYSCPLKCMYCNNIGCLNFGTATYTGVGNDCGCSCLDDTIYDKANYCNFKANVCKDQTNCAFLQNFLGSSLCTFPEYSFRCPLTCGKCTPSSK